MTMPPTLYLKCTPSPRGMLNLTATDRGGDSGVTMHFFFHANGTVALNDLSAAQPPLPDCELLEDSTASSGPWT